MNRIPIRIRLTLLASAAGALVALIVGGLVASTSASSIREDFDASLVEEAAETMIAVRSGLPLSTFAHPGSSYGVVIAGIYDQTGLIDTTDLQLPELPPGLETGRLTTVTDSRSGDAYRVLALPIPDTMGGLLVVGVSTASIDQKGSELARNVLILTIVGVGVVAIGSYLITGLLLRPIGSLTRSAASLGRDPAGQRLEMPRADDEVRALAETLNAGLKRIDQVMDTQRRFVTDASHELRTPLARLRADIDLARRPERSREELLQALGQIDEHAEHLTSLADSLLGLLAPEGDQFRSPTSTTAGEILAAVKERTPVHDGVTFRMSDEIGVSVLLCDFHGLVGSISNLIQNALRHGAPPIEVSADRWDGGMDFTVRDRGPGIPFAQREELLEPFAQGPSAENGSGLGLTIVSAFAERQGGTLVIEDGDPGCRMVLRIPFSPLMAEPE